VVKQVQEGLVKIEDEYWRGKYEREVVRAFGDLCEGK
jgi:membrane protein implicated in regulation of membrane protease activity